ncbi:hypothetical protein [Kutzneria buriramensis]|nr:hypothetical protein [Kutzneria buriramensis]
MLIGSVTPTDKVLDGPSVFVPHPLTLNNFIGLLARFSGPDTGYSWASSELPCSRPAPSCWSGY